MSVNNNFGFAISSGSLNIHDINITYYISGYPCLINLNDTCSVEFKNVNVTRIASFLSYYSLISISNGDSVCINDSLFRFFSFNQKKSMLDLRWSNDYRFNNTQFININNKYDNGSVVEWEFVDPLHSNFENITITNCTDASGRGGGLFLNLDSENYFALSGSELSYCNAKIVKNSYFICPSLKNCAQRMSFVSFINESTEISLYYGSYDTLLTREVPIVVFLRNLTDAYVKNSQVSDADYYSRMIFLFILLIPQV